ncbi:MAG: hypothetical protein KDE14_13430 [Rhodobacteraceae bacterium]|nr:hypothetical protein [Paracoccaceae bacterium]
MASDSITAASKGGDVDDRDTLHTLALSIMPLTKDTLKSARMIKNSRLDSVIEMFRDRDVGSGQIDVEDLPKQFNTSALPAEDFKLLRQLALLPSYDVYSLRVSLRSQGINVSNQEALQLSPERKAQLSKVMKAFTRPLLFQVYGEEGKGIETFDQLIGLFRDPDVKKARERLMKMASKLGIEIGDIPRFLEDYADIFMSLSYYRQCLDYITPLIYEFFESLGDLRKSHQTKTNQKLLTSCKEIESTFSSVLSSVTGRLESFDRLTVDMWKDLSAERFRQIEETIKTFHVMMGGILCALTVKVDAWNAQFPSSRSGSPGRRSDFIMNDMVHGLRKIREVASVGGHSV